MAEITVSTSVARTAFRRAASPHPSSGHSVRARLDAARHSVRRTSPSAVATTASLGRNSRIWAVRASMLWPATSEYTSYGWRLRRTTSRVLVPIEPVDPRTTIVFIGASDILAREPLKAGSCTNVQFFIDGKTEHGAKCRTPGENGAVSGGFFFGRSSKPFRAPGRIASGGLYLEVSLAGVGVASPVYSNNSRFHFWKQHFFIFILKNPLPPRQDLPLKKSPLKQS